MPALLPEKKILVVGPGALGTYFAARLGHAFPRLWVLDHREGRAQQLSEAGFHVRGVDSYDWFAPERHVAARPDGWPAMDFIFFLVKAPALAKAAGNCRRLTGKDTAWVLLQNGWRAEEELKTEKKRIVLGITGEAVTLESTGRVFHAAVGTTLLDAKTKRAAEVSRLLAAAGFKVELTKDFDSARWNKLLLNAVINPIGALAGVPNGRLAENPLKELADGLTLECVRLARRAGRTTPPAEAQRRLRETIAQTAANKNSLWQDLLRGRPTERPYLLGPFLDLARRHKTPAPLLQSLDRLLQTVENFQQHEAARRGEP
ncbi:MAG TPA: 2-dehydropantoate 2-reductase [Elusimicrobiota bacterium]|nr:2-dehydropantoate 2-reductase [Elusimicrobiota bacterium]